MNADPVVKYEIKKKSVRLPFKLHPYLSMTLEEIGIITFDLKWLTLEESV